MLQLDGYIFVRFKRANVKSLDGFRFVHNSYVLRFLKNKYD